MKFHRTILTSRTSARWAFVNIARKVQVAINERGITDGRLDFGTWERIFCGIFDGKRVKRVMVGVIGE